MIAHFRQTAALYCAAIDGDKLADGIVIPHFESSRFALVTHVLWRQAYRREREEPVVRADLGRSIDDDVGNQFAMITNFDLGANNAVWPDFAGWRDSRRGINNCCGVDVHVCEETERFCRWVI